MSRLNFCTWLVNTYGFEGSEYEYLTSALTTENTLLGDFRCSSVEDAFKFFIECGLETESAYSVERAWNDYQHNLLRAR